LAADLTEFFNFAVETAYLAGKSTLGYFRTELKPNYKTDDTPVTIADQRAEELIRSRIEKNYPDHAIVGEELGQKISQGSIYRWLIDPIDGTKAFIHGVPLYAVLIGLEIEDEVQVGAAYFPALDEMLAAGNSPGAIGSGIHKRTCFRNKQPYSSLATLMPGDLFPGRLERCLCFCLGSLRARRDSY
jgi:histidinol-phosphatase